MDRESQQVRADVERAESLFEHALFNFGSDLVRERYPDLEWWQAVDRFLIDKYRWLPTQVRELSKADRRLLLIDQIHGEWRNAQPTEGGSPDADFR